MAKKIKITRKQIKQDDEFLHVIKEAARGFYDYKNYFLIGVGILLAAAIVWGITAVLVSSSRSKAQNELGDAEKIFTTPVIPEAALAKNPELAGRVPVHFPTEAARYEAAASRFEAVSESLSGKRQSVIANLYAGIARQQSGQCEQALPSFKKVTDTSDATSPLVSLAWQGIGACAENAGRYDEAVAAYRKMTENPTSKSLVKEGRLNLARVYEATNKTDEAVAVLTEYLSEAGDDAADKAEIEQRISALKGA